MFVVNLAVRTKKVRIDISGGIKMIISHNVSSLNACKNIANVDNAMSKSIAKLSSGLRINSAGDDAAGLAISEKMRSQVKGMDMAKRNCQDVVSLLQTAEGALESISNMLTRLKELAVQAGNGVYNDQDLANVQLEVKELIAQIDVVAETTAFNGLNILNGTYAQNGLKFQIGITPSESITVKIPNMKSTEIGQYGNNGTVNSIKDVDVTQKNLVTENLAAIDDAIQDITSTRAIFGSVQNRAEYTMSNLSTNSENLTSAESRIRDVNIASEMANYSGLSILVQSGMSVLAQSNQKTSYVLKLLQ